MPTSTTKRKVAPNDAPVLPLVVLVLIAHGVFTSAQTVLGTVLLGIVPVLWVMALRQLPWCRLRGRWQWGSIAVSGLALTLSIAALYRVGYAQWWLIIVLFFLFCAALIGMQLHRWTSLFMAVCCALAGWLLL